VANTHTIQRHKLHWDNDSSTRYHQSRRLFDDTEIGNSGLRQIGGLNHSSEATTDDDNINVFDDRLTGKAGLDVRVTIELFVVALEFFVLADAVGAKTLFAFNAILLASFFQRKLLVVVIPHGCLSPSRLSAYLSLQE